MFLISNAPIVTDAQATTDDCHTANAVDACAGSGDGTVYVQPRHLLIKTSDISTVVD